MKKPKTISIRLGPNEVKDIITQYYAAKGETVVDVSPEYDGYDDYNYYDGLEVTILR